MKVRRHHLIISFGLAAAVIVGSAWLLSHHNNALAACGTGMSINITSPLAGATIAGSTGLHASVIASTQPTGVTYYVSAPTGFVLGNATATPSGTGADWVYTWNTSSVANGGYQIMAVAHYGTNTAYDCPSQPLPLNVNNQSTTTQPTLKAAVTPSTSSLLAGKTVQFQASGTYINQQGQQFALSSLSGVVYKWEASGGSLSTTTGPITTYTAGPQAGNYAIGVVITASGLTQPASAAIQIAATNATGSTSGTTTTSGSSGSTATTDTTVPAAEVSFLTGTASIFRPIAPTNSAPVVPIDVLACVHDKLGSDYSAISSGQAQPSVEQRLKASSCFSGPNPIPAVLAPVDPHQIAQVPQDKNLVKLDSIKNTTVTDSSGKQVNAIKLSGSAASSSDVYIYFFSDPLVLKTTSDADGKWNYTLEDPVAPGKHEVYAVAAKDASTFVRTPVFPLAVAAAAGGQSGNLIVASRWQPGQIGFLAAGILLVILVLLALIIWRHFAKHHRPSQLQPANPTAGPEPPPTAPPTQPTPPHDLQP